MAVQAQCCSNIILFNRTLHEGKTQIGNNYSFPPQPGNGGSGVGVATTVLDHQYPNYTLFNNFPVGNCSTNQRKREREDNMNQFISNIHKKQSHCNQIKGVSHIESRNVDVSTGLRLAFNDNQQQHSFNYQPYGSVSLLSEDLSHLINQQGDEIECYIQAQGEELRLQLAEKWQRHCSALIGAAKEMASRMLREKEAVAEKAVRRNAELEARASQLSGDAQVWLAKAKAQQAVVMALQAQLQQTIVAGGGGCVSPGEEVAAGGAWARLQGVWKTSGLCRVVAVSASLRL